MHDVDVAIVGAGASGLAAARALSRAPVSVLVLEARSRLGGRACTVMAGGHALDLGCGWLHSADVNPFSDLAQALGFPVDKTAPHWTRQAWNAGFTAQQQAHYAEALAALEARIDAAALQGRDQAASDLMEPGGLWNPLLDAFSSYYNGAEFDQISTLDYARYRDTEVNWRTPRGYGALVTAMGAEAPVSLATPVTRIDHSGARIALDTARGTLLARAVIVAAPTPHIAEGDLAFYPDLPDVRAAAACLPLGLANKVFLGLSDPTAFPPEGHLFGDPFRTATGSYHLRPFGRPVVEAYLGGAHARALEAEGPDAAAAFVIDELASLAGASIRAVVTPLAASAWAEDPWSRGAYSHAVPGGAWARAALAAPVNGRLFFAGEAASLHGFSTTHGAFQAGENAARLALAALERSSA